MSSLNSPKSPEELNRFLELAKLSQADIHDRRKAEFKLLLGYWGGLGILIFGLFSEKALITRPIAVVGTAVLALLCLTVARGCIWALQKSHALDRAFFVYFTKTAEGVEAKRPASKSDFPIHKDWLWGEITVSVLLTLTAILAMWANALQNHVRCLLF